MKKHIYILAVLCNVSISYPIFGQGDAVKRRVIELIERQIRLKRNAATAWDHILRKTPNRDMVNPHWSSTFLEIYPDMCKMFARSPEELHSMLENGTPAQ